jgi:protein subunit release factor A
MTAPPPPPSYSPADATRALQLDDEHLLRECEESFFVASGPGGQHRNKTSSGVRLAHLPSGIVITATERRSQLMNRGAALERLRERLKQKSFVPVARKKTKVSRGLKRRRLEDKRKHSEKKQGRRGEW